MGDTLTPDQISELDSNIKAMLKQGATQDDVMRYSDDYNKLKKKVVALLPLPYQTPMAS